MLKKQDVGGWQESEQQCELLKHKLEPLLACGQLNCAQCITETMTGFLFPSENGPWE